MISLASLARYSWVVSAVVGLPTSVGTLIEVMRTRREAKEAREGLVFSQNCLEFLLEDGTLVNLVPLETLHSLPKVSDVVLLPGSTTGELAYGAYRVTRVEHIYSRVDGKKALAGQARLAKAVVHVEMVTGSE